MVSIDPVPLSKTLDLIEDSKRSTDKIQAIDDEKDINRAAVIASASLRNARVFFDQARIVSDEIRPILYYYGSTFFLEFATSVLVRRVSSSGSSHGVKVSCGSDGSDFDSDWPRKQCLIESKPSGDFSFFVDALTIGGLPSFFSGFRLYRNRNDDPWMVIKNPSPLFAANEKISLDKLCNFDHKKYLEDSPEVNKWLEGTDSNVIWKTSTLLMDFLIVFIASNLARYYIPAWRSIVEADKSNVYNDIRFAYKNISEGFPYFLKDQYPFSYSFIGRLSE